MKNFNVKTQIKNTCMLLLSFVVLSTTAWASDLSKMESLPIKPVISSDYEYLIHTLNENEFEETLTIEEWMLNPESFTQDNWEEPSLEVESWMTDVETFMSASVEADLVLEAWMSDLASFLLQDQEAELAVEDWMLHTDSFEEEQHTALVLEDWMTDLSSFIPNVVALASL